MEGTGSQRAPEPFGKYVLLDRIGAGGMAEVFQAVAGGPEGFQRSLVIKRMLPNLSQDAAFVRMFIDEAKLSGLLSHPNLVQIFEFGKVDDSFFIAMEYVHGRTLAAIKNKLSQQGRVAPVSATVEIARQICRGLDYAHSLESPEGQSLGIVHRDISPPNVMLDFHGVVKILDFGIARVAEGLRESRTQVGTMKGKVSYMSPEQLRLEDIDRRSDIFAVGIVLHEMLTGQRLFKGTNEYESSRMVLELDVPLPSDLNAEVSPELDGIVMRALQRNPDARYPNAGEMALALQGVAGAMSLSPHEHLKLLEELFPGEAMATKKGMTASGTMPAATSFAPPPSSEQPTSFLRPAGRGNDDEPSRRHWRENATETSVRKWATRFLAGMVTSVALVLAVLLGSRLEHRLEHRYSTTTVAATPVVAAAPETGPVRIHLSIDSNPQDAQVIQVDTGVLLGRTPLATTVPRSVAAISFRLEKKDFQPAIYKIIPDLDKIVRVDLARSPEASGTDRKTPSADPAAVPAPRATESAKQPRHRHVASPVRKLKKGSRLIASPATAAASSSSAGVAAQDCFLTIGSFPWADLWIDGRNSGQPTPVVRLPVTCGPHKLRFTRDTPPIDRVVNITVTPDREFKQNFQLVSGDVDQ